MTSTIDCHPTCWLPSKNYRHRKDKRYQSMHLPPTGCPSIIRSIPTRRKALVESTRYICCHKGLDRKSTRLNSSHVAISYAAFCLKEENRSEKGTGHVQQYGG